MYASFLHMAVESCYLSQAETKITVVKSGANLQNDNYSPSI